MENKYSYQISITEERCELGGTSYYATVAEFVTEYKKLLWWQFPKRDVNLYAVIKLDDLYFLDSYGWSCRFVSEEEALAAAKNAADEYILKRKRNTVMSKVTSVINYEPQDK